MAYTREAIVNVMRSWLGAKQYDATHKEIVDTYNKIQPLPRGYKLKYSDAWCAACVSAAFQRAGFIGINPAECSCAKMVEKAKSWGIWVESDGFIPKPGDIIMYDWQDNGAGDNTGTPDHTGIVEDVSNGKIVILEGNYNKAVRRRRLDINGKYIRGYITPKYPAEVASPEVKSNMKYSAENPPLVCYMTQSTWYNGARKAGKPVGILWHDTGAGNPNLKRYVQPDDNAPDRDYWFNLLGVNQYHNDWNHIQRTAGVNCFIGKLADGTVATVQVGPWDTHAWGCGHGSKGSCNGNVTVNGKTTWVDPFWIQFEICDDGYTDPNYFAVAYEEACQITAYLCKMFDIDPNGTVEFNGVQVPTILCHNDSNKLKLGDRHNDVLTWFSRYGYTMGKVREDVAKLMQTEPIPSPDPFEIKVGDVVNFVGNVQYTNANAATGKTCKGGPAKVTAIYQPDKSAHPYHLIAVKGGGSSVYGWVDKKYIQPL